MRFIRTLAGTAFAGCLALTTGCASASPNSVPVGAGSSATSGNAAPGNSVMVKDDANGKTVHVHVGDKVDLLLSSSYWMINGSSATRVLRQDGSSTVLPRPSSCPTIPGLGCQPVQTNFTATAVGTSIVTANRTTCGEAMRCPSDKQHFLVTIVVE